MKPSAKTLSEIYQKKTPIQHILDRPDTYVDSLKVQEDVMDIFDDDLQKIIKKNIKSVPALYKIFDEIIVNAFDHTKTDSTCDTIKVSIDKEKNEISVFNNGKGIDVEIHPEHKIYIPELIFGELLTSTNYDDTEARTTGGRNGYGAKLTNIFSTKFVVETVDEERKRKFHIEFSDNMSKRTKPKVTDYKLKSYTQITFVPDLKKFGLDSLSDDIIGLFKKRVYDIAGLGEKLKVYYNDKKIDTNNFKKYISLYYPDEEVHYDEQERWKVGVIYKPDNNFEQKSFVNGICTYKGGNHVEYVMKGIIKKVKDAILKKNKDLKIKDELIKENLIIFIDSTIVNPAFSSQTKEELKTKQSEFGTTYEMNDKIVTKIVKSGIVEFIIDLAKNKEKSILKNTDGKKTNNIKGIPKLEDAEWAGTKKSVQCRLILTEGDSAKGLAMAGRSAVEEGNCKYGVFPLKGKLLNVREATSKQLLENEEIINIKKILGLQHNKEYSSVSELRYSSVVILTDQDSDGFHIKGLLMNFFHYFFPSLLKLNFIHSLATPIVKAIKGKDAKTFYNLTEYEDWKKKVDTSTWHIKYYKGLGTSNREEAKEYFNNFETKLIKYTYADKSLFATDELKGGEKEDVDDLAESETSSKRSNKKGTTKKLKTTTVEDTNKEHICYEAMTLAFDKKRADDRKVWLKGYDRNKILQNDLKEIPICDFVHRELIHFSNDDINRSIPSVVDGMKPSQRKVQYGSILRKLNKKQDEIKVAQLSGFISEKTSYHHGEASLQGTIVGMGQIFVGANNLNHLHPSGQFGCLSPETEILMWNGSIKKAEDIIIGDILIGDDGEERNVLKITNGIDEMYEIMDDQNKKMIVNSQHILTLYFNDNFVIKWKESTTKWYFNYFNGKTISQISIETNEDLTNIHFNRSRINKTEGFKIISTKLEELKKTYNNSNIIDIKLEDYLKLSNYAKRGLYMISNINCINWEKKKVPLDPYILGAWLGDGDQAGKGFTSCDEEIIKRFVIWSDTINAEITHHSNKNHDGYHYSIRRKGSGHLSAIGSHSHSVKTCIGCQTSDIKLKHNTCDWKYEFINNKEIEEVIKIKNMNKNIENLNPFTQLLKDSNLYMNKHIPIEYMINDKETRLQLLAGFIDTDGTIRYNNSSRTFVEISQSERLHKNLILSLDFIAKSLGYATSIYYSSESLVTKKGESKKMMTLRIMGDNIDEIPTIIQRKKITFSGIERDRKTMHFTKFTINNLGKNKFCGWSIDKNERFLLGNFVVTHNSRLLGGKDSASPRYIFTYLEEWNRLIFRPEDDAILTYLNDDGTSIEPEYYVPIIPMVLVNGAQGIGTGFSTTILQYNPIQIIDNLLLMMESKPIKEMLPWYRGFKGKVEKSENGFNIKGNYKVDKDRSSIVITELPVGTWTTVYKEHLDKLEEDKVIKGYKDKNTDETVFFDIQLTDDNLYDLIEKKKLEQVFKLTNKETTSNMHCFNKKSVIKKYDTIYDILKEFYEVRLDYYKKRKQYQLDELEKELNVLDWKMKFIEGVIEGTIIVNNQTKEKINDQLTKLEFPKLSENKSYDYLVQMPIYSLSKEKIDELQKKIDNLEEEMELIQSTTEINRWKSELIELKKSIEKVYKSSEVIEGEKVVVKGKLKINL